MSGYFPEADDMETNKPDMKEAAGLDSEGPSPVPAESIKKHWSSSPWKLMALLTATLPLVFISPIVADGMFIFLFLYVHSERKFRMTEPFGTIKLDLSTLVAFAVAIVFCLLYAPVFAFIHGVIFSNVQDIIPFDESWAAPKDFNWYLSILSDKEFLHVFFITVQVSMMSVALMAAFVFPLAFSVCLLFPTLRHAGKAKCALLIVSFLVVLFAFLILLIILLGNQPLNKDAFQQKLGYDWSLNITRFVVIIAAAVMCLIVTLQANEGKIIDSVLLILPVFSLSVCFWITIGICTIRKTAGASSFRLSIRWR